MVAVGTFLPVIEILDLNKEYCEPVCTLGDYDNSNSIKKKKKAKIISSTGKQIKSQS